MLAATWLVGKVPLSTDQIELITLGVLARPAKKTKQTVFRANFARHYSNYAGG
jgi:hypothetical protein